MVKKTIRFLSKEVNFVLFSILIVTILGLYASFYHQWVIRPQNTIFTFAHNYMPDYYQYLSWMKDGLDGKILVTSRFSPDNFARKPVYLFYSILGRLTGSLSIPLFLGYTFTRIFLSLLKLFVVYFLIAKVFSQARERKLAFAFALFLPPFYSFFPLKILLSKVASVDPLQRTFFIPHDLLTTILMILGTIFLANWFSSGRQKLLVVSAGLFLASAIANPAMLTLYYLFLGTGVLLSLVNSKIPKNRLILGSALAIILSLPVLGYYQLLFKSTLPFSWMYQQQKVVRLAVSFKDYLLSCGPTIILFPFGVLLFLRKKEFLFNFIISWAILPFLIFPFLGTLLPLSMERLFEMSHFIPLTILSAAGFYQLIDRLQSKKTRVLAQKISGVSFLVFAAFYFYLSVKFQVDFFKKPYFNIYLPESVLEAFSWLDQNTPDESVVAAGYYTSNMIPAFSHNKVIFGHDFVTYQSHQRFQENEALFKSQTPVSEIETILKKNQVKYVLLTPETAGLETLNLGKIKTLKVVYQNPQNLVLETDFTQP